MRCTVENNPCDTCALIDGSAANEEPHNALKAQLCVLGGVPFYCHEGIDWKDPATHSTKILPHRGNSALRMKHLRPCETWKRQVKALAARGYFKENARIKRGYAQIALGAMAWLSTGPRDEDKHHMKTLRGCINALLKERDKFLLMAAIVFASFLLPDHTIAPDLGPPAGAIHLDDEQEHYDPEEH